MTDDMHTCSYHCDRPECIRVQRDELRDELAKLRARIEAAPEWYNHPDWVGVGPSGVLTGLEGKRIRLLVEESIKPK